jgi:peptidoglycan/xylan/chitin deacetylase (PgdA/CDA1 family)
MLLTFDDGYRNNLSHALPVLEKYETPCILFITTGFVEGTVYPYELELAEIIERADTLLIPGWSEPTQLSTLPERQALYDKLRLPLKPKSHADRDRFMERLADHNEYERTEVQNEPLLSWEEVRSLSDHPLVTIGAHTQFHTLLSQQSWRSAYEELKTSKRQLERKIGQPVVSFSYPYGGNNAFIRQIAKWLGFQYGFTTDARQVARINMWNRLSLPRIDIGNLITGYE